MQVIDLQNHWTAWWSKVNIFNGENYRDCQEGEEGIVVYIDLDMIITGSIDDLVLNFRDRFSTMSTNDIFCEQTQDGYNSSIMVFRVF